MLISFSGKGFLVPIVSIGSLVLAEYSVETYFHDQHYYQQHGGPKLAGFWLAALIVAAISRAMREREGRRLIDPETGSTVIVHDRPNAFFFLPLKYWPAALFALGIVFSFVVEK
jgi:hypothetical protein